MSQSLVILVLDLTGTFAFGLNGALTAVRAVRLDLVGVLVLGVMTALGGGIIRDVLLNVSPAAFTDVRYLAVATGGALLVFLLSVELERFTRLITVFDAVGLSVFCVTGASTALATGLGSVQAVLLGVIAGVGGGTLRDVVLRRVPTVLTSDFYAVPALVGAVLVVVATNLGIQGLVGALVSAAVTFVLRMLGVRYGLSLPGPRQGGSKTGESRPRRRGRRSRGTDEDTA
ncbi:trimeric intracellular cation channel family protein [Saccharomonospora iraqiensis]|uniref:trimeric intracellular cation channel family protein n=1 Tax=Saccharomonospora iraqiensis TaxID=52698 RepID=UPI00022E2485|nr:trimeric intracellular cation channel family protein [Saccharomonospora iraqiensis]